MKQTWQKLAVRLDAMSLRERVLVFACALFVMLFLLNAILIDPVFKEQKKISERVAQNQAETLRIQTNIQTRAQAQGVGGDQANQARLVQLRADAAKLRADLTGAQKNLVPPEKMSLLLEDILKRNGRLRLVSLKNLPLEDLSGTKEKQADAATARSGGIYRHGVEIVVRGNYLDMMNYLSALEKMSWELYWGSVKFDMETYPVGTLHLTVYTLSLDKSWLNL